MRLKYWRFEWEEDKAGNPNEVLLIYEGQVENKDPYQGFHTNHKIVDSIRIPKEVLKGYLANLLPSLLDEDCALENFSINSKGEKM